MIRLSRVGKKHHPVYRVVVSEKTKDTVGDYLELVGTYDPHANQADLKADRIKYWIEHGAQPSGTVHNLLVDQKVISGEKRAVANIKKKATPEGEGAAAAAKPAEGEKPAEQPAAETKPAEEKPAETAPAEQSATPGSAGRS